MIVRELQKRPLFWLLLLAVLLRVGAALALGNQVLAQPGIHDQISYHTLATRLVTGHGFTFDQDWWPLTKAGQPTAHWSYLYTVGLAALYRLVGVQPLLVRVMQALAAGILLPLLLYRLSQPLFGKTVALFTAAWGAVYGYFIYYAAALMTETFYIIAVLAILYVLQQLGEQLRAQPKFAWQKWLLWGVLLALAGMLRQVVLLLVPFACLWLLYIAWQSRLARQIQHALLGIALAGVTALALIAPITWHNYRTFGTVVMLNTNAGYAFFWGNHPYYGNTFIPILPSETYRDLVPVELRQLNEVELEKALLQRGVGFITSDPVRYLRLSLSRIPAYFQFGYAADSGLLSNVVRIASFGIALPFMVVGILYWLRQVWRGKLAPNVVASGWLLLGFAASYTAIHILTWALIRYRLPVDAVLLPFAAQALALLVLPRLPATWRAAVTATPI